jgi:hypothetical protein
VLPIFKLQSLFAFNRHTAPKETVDERESEFWFKFSNIRKEATAIWFIRGCLPALHPTCVQGGMQRIIQLVGGLRATRRALLFRVGLGVEAVVLLALATVRLQLAPVALLPVRLANLTTSKGDKPEKKPVLAFNPRNCNYVYFYQ